MGQAQTAIRKGRREVKVARETMDPTTRRLHLGAALKRIQDGNPTKDTDDGSRTD